MRVVVSATLVLPADRYVEDLEAILRALAEACSERGVAIVRSEVADDEDDEED